MSDIPLELLPGEGEVELIDGVVVIIEKGDQGEQGPPGSVTVFTIDGGDASSFFDPDLVVDGGGA